MKELGTVSWDFFKSLLSGKAQIYRVPEAAFKLPSNAVNLNQLRFVCKKNSFNPPIFFARCGMADTQLFIKSNTSQGTNWQKLVFFKMAIAKLACLFVMAVGGSIVATLNGVEWGVFTSTQKFTAVTAALMAGVSVILAFLSDTMAKLNAAAETERKSEVANNPNPPVSVEPTPNP